MAPRQDNRTQPPEPEPKSKDSDITYPPTIILRNNPGMIKDCWINDDGWLAIRQIRLDPDGGVPDTHAKIIRLSPEEQKILHKLLDLNLEPL